MKIAFLVQLGMDAFLSRIVEHFAKNNEVRKYIVTELHQVDEAMGWADVCWFEWASELVVHASRTMNKAAIVCRLHRYELCTPLINQIIWQNVHLITIAKHVADVFDDRIGLECTLTHHTVPNTVDMDRFYFTERKPGKEIAVVGYINFKKCPETALRVLHLLNNCNEGWRMHFAGMFQGDMTDYYMKHAVSRLGLSGKVVIDGWQDNIAGWLEDKQFILSCSPIEGHPMNIMEGMSCGLKPVIHHFFGAEHIFPDKYLWLTVNEAVQQILSPDYNSHEYRNLIAERYPEKKALQKYERILHACPTR